MRGHKVCVDWAKVIKGNRSFSEKLKHLFSKANKEHLFSLRPYQDATALITSRDYLAHPRFHHERPCGRVRCPCSLIISMPTIPLRRCSQLPRRLKLRCSWILI